MLEVLFRDFCVLSQNHCWVWDLISGITNFVYELSHELPNNLRHTLLGIQEIFEKSQNWVKTQPIPSLPSRIKNLTLMVKTYTKRDIKIFWSFPVLPDFGTFCQTFSQEIRHKNTVSNTLPHKLSNEVKLRISGNQENIRKMSKLNRGWVWSPVFLPELKILQ